MQNKSDAKAGLIVTRHNTSEEYTGRVRPINHKEARAKRRGAAREIRMQLSEGVDA